MESREIALLCTLLKAPEAKLEVKDIADIDWPIFYKLIVRHRLWHRLLPKLNAFLECHHTPQTLSFLSLLKQRSQQDLIKIMHLYAESIHIANLFSEKKIRHAFIKGITLNEYLYGSMKTRPSKDIDLWVDLEHYDQAMQVLMALGYTQNEPLYELSGFKKTYHFKHRYDVAFWHPKKKILIELHFKLEYLGIPFFSFEKVGLKQVSVGNKHITTLEDDEHLLFLMLHGAIHGWNRLRWLEDIHLFIQLKDAHLDKLFALADELQCRHIVEQSLLLLIRFFPCDHLKIAPYLTRVSRQARSLYNMAELFITSHYEQIDGLRNPKLFFLYRYYLVRLAPKHKKITVLFSDLFKLYHAFPDFSFSERFFWLYYFVYPYWVIRFSFMSARK